MVLSWTIGLLICKTEFCVQAASLAEKYFDFAALVRICEETENREKLEQYTTIYQEHNFSGAFHSLEADHSIIIYIHL